MTKDALSPKIPEMPPGKAAPLSPKEKGSAPEAKKPGITFFSGPKKVKEFSKKQQVDLYRGIGSMLRAQINTADALKYYGQGIQDKVMADCLEAIRNDINAGMNVHEAFRRTKRFNETVIGLIQAGSDAGQLHEAFRSLAARITSELKFQKAIRKATVMPGSSSGCCKARSSYRR
jgi:type II secretory pathway component PulF